MSTDDTTDSTNDTTFDLEQAVASMAALRRQTQRAARAAEQAKQQAETEQAIVLLQDTVTSLHMFTPGFLESVNAEYQYNSSDSRAMLVFHYHGAEWKLLPNGRGISMQSTCMIDRPREGRLYDVALANVQSALLASFAEYLAHEQEVEARVKANQRIAAAAEQQQQAQAERDLADATVCAAEVEAALAEARKALWQWPQGATLTLYKWRWQTGAGDDGTCDYDDGYSLYEQLDERGYVVLLSGRREIRLIPEVHRPVVERITLTSMDALIDLPYATSLYTTKRLTLEGMIYYTKWISDKPSLDNWQQFRHAAGEQVRLEVGSEPIDAIKAVLS